MFAMKVIHWDRQSFYTRDQNMNIEYCKIENIRIYNILQNCSLMAYLRVSI